MMAIVVRGDALNKDDIQKAFDQIEEVDAVVSTLGGTPGDPTADSQVCAGVPLLRHGASNFVLFVVVCAPGGKKLGER